MIRTIATIGVGVITAIAGAVALSSGTGCTAAPVDATAVAAADVEVAGYSGDQLTNAALIINAATAAGVSQQGKVIAVMTAIGESDLHNLAGTSDEPLGLFQQTSLWGSVADRMDPSRAASFFYAALVQVPNWASLHPSAAAATAQGSASPTAYTFFVQPASEIVEALSTQSASEGCGSEGWITPVDGHKTSPFGWRILRGTPDLHTGTDLAAPCGTQVNAASPGVVVFAAEGWNGGSGNEIKIDHGGGIRSQYGHLLNGSIKVQVGDQIMAGIPIARVGTTGNSTGCHLHFEIQVDRKPVDAEKFYLERGLVLKD